MADLASFSLSDRRAAPHSRAHQYRLTAVSATWRGQAAGHAGGREGGEGGGEGRGLSTLSTNQNLCDRGA